MSSWEQKLVQTSRGVFEIFLKGKGKPLCVTHGYSEFNDTGDYFAESFTDNFQVILVNLREVGNSDKASFPHELSMIDAVLDLEEVRKTLKFSKWIFAGHSTGGMIGLLYGIHFSTSLESLIIVGAAARDYSSSPNCIYNQNHPNYKRMQELMELLKEPNLSEEDRQKYTEERTKFSLFEPDNYNQYFAKAIHKRISAMRLNFFGREMLIFDVSRQLVNISVQTLILCGKHDVQCPISYSVDMSERIPNSTLHMFEGSNHYPFIEEEKAFKNVIKNFLHKELTLTL